MDKKDIDELLTNIYYKQKNYDGVNELYRKSKPFNKKLTKDNVKNWLKLQSTHQITTTKKIKKREYLKIYSNSHYAYNIDLTFMPKYKKQNNNYYVIFTAINVNSRYAYAYYAKDKSEESIIEMFNKWLKNCLIIESVTMDEGTEFTNKKIKKWFEDNDIETFFTSDSHKLAIINRFHRTLKDKLIKYFLSSDSTRWIDVIDEIIKNYNNTINSGIGFTPKQASKPMIQNYIINKKIEESQGIEKINDEDEVEHLSINDKVRIRIKSDIFDKGKLKYGEYIYTVTNVYKNSVDLENDKYKINKIKKSDLKKVNGEVQNYKPNINKKNNEKIAKVDRLLKKEDIEPEKIIREKRPHKNIDYKQLNKTGF